MNLKLWGIFFGFAAVVIAPQLGFSKSICTGQVIVHYEYKKGAKLIRTKTVWDSIKRIHTKKNACEVIKREVKKFREHMTDSQKNNSGWNRHQQDFQTWFCNSPKTKFSRKSVGSKHFRVLKTELKLKIVKKKKLVSYETVDLGFKGVLPSNWTGVPWSTGRKKHTVWMKCGKCSAGLQRIGLGCYGVGKLKCKKDEEWHFDSGWKCKTVTYRNPGCENRKEYRWYVDRESRRCYYERKNIKITPKK